jgi:hypothetical protein
MVSVQPARAPALRLRGASARPTEPGRLRGAPRGRRRPRGGVVGDADDRGAVLGGGAAQHPDDHLAVLAVEGRGRFVGEQQDWATWRAPGRWRRAASRRRKARDGRWCMRGARPDLGQRLDRRSRAAFALHPLVAQHAGHLFVGGQRREQVEALEDEAAVVEAEAVDLAGRRLQRSSPSALTVPSSGFSRPDSAAIRVDLPEPDGPMTMVTWPASASKSTSRSTTAWVRPVLNRLVRTLGGDGGGHRSRSAGWLFFSMPIAIAPEMMAITIIMTQTKHRDGRPHQRQADAVPPSRAMPPGEQQGGDGPGDTGPERQLHHDQPQRAHRDAERAQRGELADVGQDRSAQGLGGDADPDQGGQKTEKVSSSR